AENSGCRARIASVAAPAKVALPPSVPILIMDLHATWRRLTRKQPALFQIRDREPVVFPGLLEAIGVASARHLDNLRSFDEGLELVGALPREILGADDDQ